MSMNQPSPPPALKNREILKIIFDEFIVQGRWEEFGAADSERVEGQEVEASRARRRIQLRNLAVTCKDFKDVALDCLWYSVPSLLPLIKLIPSLELVYSSYSIREPIPANSAFFKYACRVRVMDLQYPRRSRAGSKNFLMAWISIAKDLKSEPLCLNATTLSMTIDDAAEQKEAFAVLPLLLSANIQSARFYGPGLSARTFDTQCLSLLSRISATLRTPVIDNPHKNLGPDVLDPIRHLTNLKILEIRLPSTPSIHPIVIYETVRALKELQSLTFDIHFTARHQPEATNVFVFSAETLKLCLQLSSLRLISRVADGVCPCIPRFLLGHRAADVTIIFPETMDFEAAGVFAPMASSLFKLKPVKSIKFSPANALPTPVDGRKTSLSLLCQANAEEIELDFPIRNWPLALFIFHAFGDGSPTSSPPLKNLTIQRSIQPLDDEGLTHSCLLSVGQDALGLEQLKTPLRRSFLSKLPNRHRTIGEWVKSLLQGPKSKSSLKTLAIYDPIEPVIKLSREQHLAHSQIAQVMDLIFPLLVEIKPYEESESCKPYWRNHWGTD